VFGLAECTHLICHSLCYYFSTTTEKQKKIKKYQINCTSKTVIKIRYVSVESSTHIHPTCCPVALHIKRIAIINIFAKKTQ